MAGKKKPPENRRAEGAPRGPRGRFEKGKSGNPGGRPKALDFLRELAQQHDEDAITTLAEIMKNPKSDSRARVAAAKELIDRGYGKAPQSIHLSGAEGGPIETVALDKMTNEQLEQLSKLLDGAPASAPAGEGPTAEQGSGGG